MSVSVTAGIIIALEDDSGEAANRNRVKVRIPTIHGPTTNFQIPEEYQGLSRIPDEELPWVPICYPVGTTERDKSLLRENEVVYVIVVDGGSDYLIIGTSTSILETGA